MSTSELLGQFCDAINFYGLDSEDAKKLLTDHQDNQEFVELANALYAYRKRHDEFTKKQAMISSLCSSW